MKNDPFLSKSGFVKLMSQILHFTVVSVPSQPWQCGQYRWNSVPFLNFLKCLSKRNFVSGKILPAGKINDSSVNKCAIDDDVRPTPRIKDINNNRVCRREIVAFS